MPRTETFKLLLVAAAEHPKTPVKAAKEPTEEESALATKKAELAAEKERRLAAEKLRIEEFTRTCEAKLLPIFQQVIEYGPVEMRQAKLVFDMEITDDKMVAFHISLECSNPSATKSWNQTIQLNFRIVMDAYIAMRKETKLVANAYVIDNMSPQKPQEVAGGFIRKAYIKPTTLQGKGSRGWKSKVQKEVIKFINEHFTKNNLRPLVWTQLNLFNNSSLAST
jgi:hypothetical protein